MKTLRYIEFLNEVEATAKKYIITHDVYVFYVNLTKTDIVQISYIFNFIKIKILFS